MGVTVRRSSGHIDHWSSLHGETRWVDYSCERQGDELVVYIHTFRRVRDRFDSSRDLLMWKPDTTRVAHRYGADEWDEVTAAQREWPPATLQYVARGSRRSWRPPNSRHRGTG